MERKDGHPTHPGSEVTSLLYSAGENASLRVQKYVGCPRYTAQALHPKQVGFIVHAVFTCRVLPPC